MDQLVLRTTYGWTEDCWCNGSTLIWSIIRSKWISKFKYWIKKYYKMCSCHIHNIYVKDWRNRKVSCHSTFNIHCDLSHLTIEALLKQFPPKGPIESSARTRRKRAYYCNCGSLFLWNAPTLRLPLIGGVSRVSKYWPHSQWYITLQTQVSIKYCITKNFRFQW